MDIRKINDLTWDLAHKIEGSASLAVVKEYVEKGARVDYVNYNIIGARYGDFNLNSLVMVACCSMGYRAASDLEKIKQCMRQKNVVRYLGVYGRSALMYACQKGNFEIALMLISAGADINAKDETGKTVLNYAAEGGNAEIMKLLLAQGADTGAKN